MHFASGSYAVLLVGSFVLFWGLSRWRLARLTVLLLASYAFYAAWDARYLALIVGSSALDYVAGRQIHRAGGAATRKAWLAASLVGNLGLLTTFKYGGFLGDNLSALLGALGIDLGTPDLGLLLPVGISFYTFQSMSYTLDIYRGALRPVRGPLAFFVFVAFFPQLVAGPIVRARELLPQLEGPPRLPAGASGESFYLIGRGLVKKLIIADLLAINLVDRVFELPARYTSAEILAGIYGYALQIYCDFSAYTDIALGSALLLGFALPENFHAPYLATSLRDFWRRWHVTLSTWLRDYLYLPLGGSRGSRLGTYRNLLLTMVLGGLWHGAAWNFVAWGLLHGLGLALTRAWQERRGLLRASAGPPPSAEPIATHGRRARASSGRPPMGTPPPAAPSSSPLGRIIATLLTFHAVCLGWVFFRAESFGAAADILRGLTRLSAGTANITPLVWGLLAAGYVSHALPSSADRRLRRSLTRWPAPLQATALFLVILAIRKAATTEIAPFIYFQF